MSQSYAKSPAAERKFTTREMVLVGMFAAVLAVISQISLPMPTGVPITIQVFGVALVGAVLGSRLGTTATLVYVLLGAIGLPIFANFSGGISSIVGVTGGYIWAWPIMTWLCGIRPKTENKTKNLAISIGFALIGLLITAILLVKNVKGNILWGILITWGLGIICQFIGLYKPDAAAGWYSLLPDFSNGISICLHMRI